MNKEKIKSLKFHIKSDDYFGTLASVLTIINEKKDSRDKSDLKLIDRILKNTIKDLLFLQKEYKITEK